MSQVSLAVRKRNDGKLNNLPNELRISLMDGLELGYSVHNSSVSDFEEAGRLEVIKDKELSLVFCLIYNSSRVELYLKYAQSFLSNFERLQTRVIQAMGKSDFLSMDLSCPQEVRSILDLLSKGAFNEADDELYVLEFAIRILRRVQNTLNQSVDYINTPACSFLSEQVEREKIQRAVTFLEQNVGTITSIKSLSRVAAINECYLKKGFKILTGKTILEYQNEKRMERAREFLNSGEYNVSQVAAILGFSSISHFSTSFKKYTGIKPCELIR